jgi:hypothetical protein
MTQMPWGGGILSRPTLSYHTKVNVTHQLIKVNTGTGSDYLLIEPTTLSLVQFNKDKDCVIASLTYITFKKLHI